VINFHEIAQRGASIAGIRRNIPIVVIWAVWIINTGIVSGNGIRSGGEINSANNALVIGDYSMAFPTLRLGWNAR